MYDIRITVVRKAEYRDLMEKYELPMENACDVAEGRVYISRGCVKPGGFCESAWQSLYPYIFALAHGAENFYDGWMRDKKSALVSCNDGFRPVSFLLEAMDAGR